MSRILNYLLTSLYLHQEVSPSHFKQAPSVFNLFKKDKFIFGGSLLQVKDLQIKDLFTYWVQFATVWWQVHELLKAQAHVFRGEELLHGDAVMCSVVVHYQDCLLWPDEDA